MAAGKLTKKKENSIRKVNSQEHKEKKQRWPEKLGVFFSGLLVPKQNKEKKKEEETKKKEKERKIMKNKDSVRNREKLE